MTDSATDGHCACTVQIEFQKSPPERLWRGFCEQAVRRFAEPLILCCRCLCGRPFFVILRTAAQQNLYDGFAETAFGRQCRLHASLWDKRLEALADTPRRSRRKRRYASFCLWCGSLRQNILKQRSARRYVKTIPICHDTHFWRNYLFFADGRLAATARGVRMLISNRRKELFPAVKKACAKSRMKYYYCCLFR